MKRSLRGVIVWACVAGFACVASRAWAQATAHTANSERRQSVDSRASYALTCSTHEYALQDFDSGTEAVVSPDRQKRAVLAKDGSLRIFEGEREIGEVALPDISADLEVAWAPDSRKFGVTYSDGGATGGFHAHVYALANGRVTELSTITRVAFDDFRKDYYCEARGWNNQYVVGWGAGSRTVFVVAEVYPTSDCGKDFGKMRGYLMTVGGKILHRYDDKTTQRITDVCWKSGRSVVQ